MSNNTVIQTNHLIPKTTKSPKRLTLSNCAGSLGRAKIEQHTVFCAEQTVAAYCSKQVSQKSGKYPFSKLE